MILRTLLNTILFASLALACIIGKAEQTLVQSANQSSQADKREDENLDTQLYLVVGTNQDVDESKMPVALETVLKRLRASLPFKHYRLAATLINRVKNNGKLNLRWVGGPLLASSNSSSGTPSFNEFNVNSVRLVQDAEGHQIVRMEGFSFGARVPVQMSSAVASTGTPPIPLVNYENTGLNTDISMWEGEPVIVGTLNVGPSDDAIILVVSAKRTSK